LGLLVEDTTLDFPSEDDSGSSIQPGFDNRLRIGIHPEIQFTLVTFDQSVIINSVTVDDVSNFGRSIFIAGGVGDVPSTFTDSFLEFLSSNTQIQTLEDNATDGDYAHNLSPSLTVDYLFIGTPPRDSDYPPLLMTGGEQFYVNSISYELAEAV